MDYITENINNTEKLIEKAKIKNKISNLLKKRYIPQIKILSKYVHKDAVILDAGVRDGLFLEQLHKKGYYCLFGADISQNSIRLCEEKGFPCFLMNIQTDEIDMVFDAIVLSHVLEHCPDPKSVIKNVGKHLREEGILLVEVPNEQYKKADNAHFFYFKTLHMLKSLFSEEKWTLLEEFKVKRNDKYVDFRLIFRKK